MNDDEFAGVVEAAQHLGLSVSELLRRGARMVAGFGPIFDGSARDAIVEFSGQMRAIGVNINQTARAMNAGLVPSNRDLQESFGRLTFLLAETREAYISLCAEARAHAVKSAVGAADGEP